MESDLLKENIKNHVRVIVEYQYSVTEGADEILKDSLTKKMVYKYNKIGNLTKRKEFDSNEMLNSKDIYLYNESGLLTVRIGFNSNEKIIFNSVFIYNENGKLLEIHRYNEDSILTHKSEFRHLRKGVQIGLHSLDEDSSLINTIVYKYNRKGDLIEVLHLSSVLNYMSEYTYKTYDRGKQMLKSEYNKYGVLTKQWVNKYDKNGNLIELNTFDSERRNVIHETYNYTYDLKNNWIRKESFKNEIPIMIKEREIEYY